MNITIIGHVCIDNNISEHVTYIGAGSPAMFMSKVYNKFPNVNFKIIAPYGRDFLSYIKNVSLYPSHPIQDWTLIYENKSLGKIRTQKALNREYAKPLLVDERIVDILNSSDLIFFAPLTADYDPAYVNDLFSKTNHNSIKILIPQGYYRDFDNKNNIVQRNFVEADRLIPMFDFVILSEQDHKDIKTISESWSKKTQVIMTLGDKGSLYLYKNKSLSVDVEAVAFENIVDSVGSGDIFSASFGYRFKLTNNIQESMEFANNIARQCLFYSANNLQFTLPGFTTKEMK